jgi:transcription initiation factor TFIID subunit 9B
MGIYNVESRVIQQLLEFSHRYASDVLQDALAFSEHAGHNEVNESDIRLAIEGKSTYSFTNPPSRDVLEEIAARRNKLPLPIIQEKYGVRLPPERHCLTAINYQVVPQKVTVKQEPKQDQSTASSTQAQSTQAQSAQLKVPPASTVRPPPRMNSAPASVLPNSSVLPTLPGQTGLPLPPISNPLSSSLLNSNLPIGMPPFIGGNLLGVRFPDSVMSSVLFPPSQLPTQTSATAKTATASTTSNIKSEDDYDEKPSTTTSTPATATATTTTTTTATIKTEPKTTTTTTSSTIIKTEPK